MRNEIIAFLKKALLLLIPLCILLISVEYKLKQIPNGYNKKRKYFENQLDSVNLLVLGASQTLFGINPEYFSLKGFNLSNVSQSLYYDKALTLKYIDKMKNLKCVIISISYYSFWYQLKDWSEGWRDYYYYYYWDIRYPDVKWYDSKNYSLIMLYTPEVTLMYAKQFFRIDLADNLYPNGWSKMDTIPNNQKIGEESGEARVEFHDEIRFENRFKEVYSQLDDFVAECKKRNINVVFVTPPVLPTYYKYTNPGVNKKNTDAVQELCNKYNFQYFDYFRDNRFTNRDFFDNDHLNFIGAEKFSRILDVDIVSKLNNNFFFFAK